VPQGEIEPGVVLKRLVEISRPAPHITPGERPQEDRSANPSSEQSSSSARSDAIRLNFRKVIAASRRSSVSHRRARQARQARKASALGAKGGSPPAHRRGGSGVSPHDQVLVLRKRGGRPCDAPGVGFVDRADRV